MEYNFNICDIFLTSIKICPRNQGDQMKNYVRFLRQEQGITQKDFAKMIGVTRQTIGALENDRYNPSLKLAYKITRVLGKTSIEEVFILTDDDL